MIQPGRPRHWGSMEHLLQSLPTKPRSAVVCLAMTSMLVGVSFLLVVELHQAQGLLGFYVLLPAIFVVSLFFDRGAGIYAAVLSTVLLYVLLTPRGSIVLPAAYIVPLLLFLAIAVGFAVVCGGLRIAWNRAAAAERAKDLLLQELGHRTKNNLSMVISMLSMQARSKSNPETQMALEKAVARIHAIARAHEHFQAVEHRGRIEMRAYLEQLCAHLGDSFREIRPIAVKVDAAEAYLPPEQAVPLGLIVNELVTNSLKHAFPGDREGTVDVILTGDSALFLTVRDNGVGRPAAKPDGTGSRLTRLLAQQLGARIEWQPSQAGCEVRLMFSLT